MIRSKILLFTLATVSAMPLTLAAQDHSATAPDNDNYTQSPAPIERGGASRSALRTSEPTPGVFLRSGQGSSVQTVSSTAGRTELRVDHGIANITVHDPDPGTLVLVDVPGGQVQLLDNGFYTFNADTNTARVLRGEADAFAGQASTPVKVKDGHQVVFTGATAQVKDFGPDQARIDMLPGEARGGERGAGYGSGFYGDGGYGGYGPYGGYGGYGPYGDGYYPYSAFGGPWGYGYPYGFYGYPYVGFGFGFRGGYGFGGGYGFRGGYGGFRGRR